MFRLSQCAVAPKSAIAIRNNPQPSRSSVTAKPRSLSTNLSVPSPPVNPQFSTMATSSSVAESSQMSDCTDKIVFLVKRLSVDADKIYVGKSI